MPDPFDAVLLIGFGGPERPEDIRPFLQNVVRGRRVPPERLEAVAHHYEQVGGRSPINELTFSQARALERELNSRGTDVPVHVGMRNWHPFLADTIRKMTSEGISHVAGVILAPQQSDASWEKYQRNVAEAISEVGCSLDVQFTPPFFDHPKFIAAAASRLSQCLERIPRETRQDTHLIFTAHSVPLSDQFHDRYADQLTASSRLVAERLEHSRWSVAYQSRSGRPEDPWLEPDVNDALRNLRSDGVSNVVIVPIGFVCDHVEILFDLDIEAAETARNIGINMQRAPAVNDDPVFIQCLAELVIGDW